MVRIDLGVLNKRIMELYNIQRDDNGIPLKLALIEHINTAFESLERRIEKLENPLEVKVEKTEDGWSTTAWIKPGPIYPTKEKVLSQPEMIPKEWLKPLVSIRSYWALSGTWNTDLHEEHRAIEDLLKKAGLI